MTDHLMQTIDDQLVIYGLKPISEVVNNKQESAAYINRVLTDYGHEVSIPYRSRDGFDFRIKHVLFSFGLGLVLASYQGLNEKIPQSFEKYGGKHSFIYIWLTTCLYHDYGYFIALDHADTDFLGKADTAGCIFSHSYCASRYSRLLYDTYYHDRYCAHARQTGRPQEEVGDHGILGGYCLYDQFCQSEAQGAYGESRLPQYQDICWRIMEHNIWKQKQTYPKGHPYYEIGADQFVSIGPSEPLLYLLSLVDTIEMTKKFCRYLDNSTDKAHFVYPKTLGKLVQVQVSEDQILVDARDLEKHIRSRNYEDSFDWWAQGVLGLEDWVRVKTEPVDRATFCLTAPRAADTP